MILATILGTPELETESPFILSCKALVCGDPMELKFIGNYAQALSINIRSLRRGDVASIGGKVRGGTILIESITVLNEIKGRNVKFYG